MSGKEADVYFIGLFERRNPHPGGGRYAAFGKHLTSEFVGSPLPFRYFRQRFARWAEYWLFRWFSPRRFDDTPYSFGLWVQELWAARHMRRHPGSVYHSLKGEVDLHNLPRWRRRSGSRLVATFHDASDWLGKAGLTEKFLKNVDGVTLLCETQLGYFQTVMPRERLFVVHHGVDTARFVPGTVKAREPVVVAVGSYCRDHKTLGESIRLVWRRNPAVRFLIVGSATAQSWGLPERIEDDRVEYIDGISDEELVDIYHHASLAVVSVWAATANNALLEAMSSGLPIVASNIGGIAEYLGTEAGLLVEPLNGEALAKGILEVLGDPAAADKMAAAGRERAVTKFDYSIVARQMAEVYKKVKSWPLAPAPVGVTSSDPAGLARSRPRPER